MSESKPENSPEFPLPDGAAPIWTHGMSLRDYFAAKAMHAALSGYFHPDTPIKANLEKIAPVAYLMADSMLKARKA